MTDPNRELAYTSVITVLHRLTDKGWLVCDKHRRVYYWQALLTKKQAQVIQAHEQLQKFLVLGNPDIIAAFADILDESASEKIQAIAKRIQAARKVREGE